MEIDIDQYLKKFRVLHEATLFPPDFSLLKENRCPLCQCKIYEKQDGSGYVCRSKKHKKFYIRKEIFDRIVIHS